MKASKWKKKRKVQISLAQKTQFKQYGMLLLMCAYFSCLVTLLMCNNRIIKEQAFGVGALLWSTLIGISLLILYWVRPDSPKKFWWQIIKTVAQVCYIFLGTLSLTYFALLYYIINVAQNNLLNYTAPLHIFISLLIGLMVYIPILITLHKHVKEFFKERSYKKANLLEASAEPAVKGSLGSKFLTVLTAISIIIGIINQIAPIIANIYEWLALRVH